MSYNKKDACFCFFSGKVQPCDAGKEFQIFLSPGKGPLRNKKNAQHSEAKGSKTLYKINIK